MARQFQFLDKQGNPKIVDLTRLMAAEKRRLVSGDGPFVLTQDGDSIFSGTRIGVSQHLKKRLERGEVGSAYRVRAGKKGVVFQCREVKPALEVINTSGNDQIDLIWSLVKDEFPFVYFLGAYVCKSIFGTGTSSQHSYGNAIDIGANPDRLQEIAEWLVARASELKLDHVIYKNRIWTKGVGWHAYTGEYHATHVHADPDPQFSGSCGVRN